LEIVNKRLKGFTLVEMIVVVCLFMMMMACVLSILKPMQKVYKDTYEYTDGQAVGDIAARYIEDELRYANRLYLYDKMDLSSGETAFIEKEIEDFRNDFYFGRPDIEKINKKDPDDIYVLKISNPKDDSDMDSRGKISRWKYHDGAIVDSESKEWAVNQGIYDDEPRNGFYSFKFEMGSWSESGGIMSVSPSNFTMDMSIYRSKRDATTLGDTYMKQTIAFSLVNIANKGTILKEKVPYINTATLLRGTGEVSRYQYHDSTTLSMTEGNDVYFIYTKVPKIEDLT